MTIKDKFSSENPYVLGIVLATAQTNQAGLQAILTETDQLASSSAFQRQTALTGSTANPVPLVTNVANQTLDIAVFDGAVRPDGNPFNPREITPFDRPD